MRKDEPAYLTLPTPNTPCLQDRCVAAGKTFRRQSIAWRRWFEDRPRRRCGQSALNTPGGAPSSRTDTHNIVDHSRWHTVRLQRSRGDDGPQWSEGLLDEVLQATAHRPLLGI